MRWGMSFDESVHPWSIKLVYVCMCSRLADIAGTRLHCEDILGGPRHFKGLRLKVKVGIGLRLCSRPGMHLCWLW